MVCKMLRKSFPDVAITIEDLVVEGDKIVNRYIERGTLTGRSFLGIEPAGQRYQKPGTTVYRVADGRLAESWGVEDTLGWFRQLGKYGDCRPGRTHRPKREQLLRFLGIFGMVIPVTEAGPRRADAVRNREKVLAAAEQVFAEEGLKAP